MAKFFNEIGDLVTASVDTVSDYVSNIGDNFQNQSKADAVKIEAQQIRNTLELEKFKKEQERKDKQQKIIENAIYSFIAILLLIVLAKLLPKFIGISKM